MKEKKSEGNDALAMQSETGTRSKKGKSTSPQRALRHGVLARKITFPTRRQREEFRALKKSWKRYFHPHGRLERFFVEEITLISWKLGITEAIEVRELLQREDAQDGISGVFHGKMGLPVSDWELPLDRGWDCQRVVVHAVASNDDKDLSARRIPIVLGEQLIKGAQSGHSHQHQNDGRLEVQAVMGSSLDTMTRYRSALKRDLYRAIETTRTVQAERRKRQEEERNKEDNCELMG